MSRPPHSGPPRPPGGEPRAQGERRERRMPPPDATGQEAAYLLKLKDARVPVAVEMLDGTVFRGVIEYYDRDMLKVNRPDGAGPNVLVRKRHVRSIREE